MRDISGAVTRAKLEAWLAEHRPELALYERDDTTRGFYRRDSTPRADFRNCGATWRDVAARLGAIEVPDTEDSGWGGARPKARPDDARGGARAPGPGKKLGPPRQRFRLSTEEEARAFAQLAADLGFADGQALIEALIARYGSQPGLVRMGLRDALLPVHERRVAQAIVDEMLAEQNAPDPKEFIL